MNKCTFEIQFYLPQSKFLFIDIIRSKAQRLETVGLSKESPREQDYLFAFEKSFGDSSLLGSLIFLIFLEKELGGKSERIGGKGTFLTAFSLLTF